MHKPARRRQALNLALHVPIVSLVSSSQGSLLLVGHTSQPSHSPVCSQHTRKSSVSFSPALSAAITSKQCASQYDSAISCIIHAGVLRRQYLIKLLLKNVCFLSHYKLNMVLCDSPKCWNVTFQHKSSAHIRYYLPSRSLSV
jgi:hypothetical protein